jgi:hypothetical protein
MTESCRHMIRIRGSREIRRVTSVTVGVHQPVIAIDVTGLTWGCGMRPCESESG